MSILDNEFQEQIQNNLKEVDKLEKHVILTSYYFTYQRVWSAFHSSLFLSFLNSNLPLLRSIMR